MLPSAIVFVDRPQYGLQFLDGTLAELGCRKILVIDAEMQQRGQYSQQDLARIRRTCFQRRSNASRGCRKLQQEIARWYRVLAVVGFSEISVLPTAFLAEAFGVRGIGVDVAKRCRNKLRMIEAFARSGVACLRYFVTDHADGLEEQIASFGGYPVIVKPLLGFASFGVIKVDSESGLRGAINRVKRAARLLLFPYYGLEDAGTGQVLIQSYVPGVEVAIDGYVQDGTENAGNHRIPGPGTGRRLTPPLPTSPGSSACRRRCRAAPRCDRRGAAAGSCARTGDSSPACSGSRITWMPSLACRWLSRSATT